jgi:hypothetical protein
MFYIIASRIPLVYSDTTNRKFLKIFILGSLLYIFIHYYLHLEVRSGIIDKIKSKLLFVMAGDFAIACTLAKLLSPIVSVPADIESDDSEAKPKYLANEKERIMKELEDRRKVELLRNQQLAQQAQIAQQAQLAQQAQIAQQAQLAQKAAQVKIQEAAAKERTDKTKVKPKLRKKDTTTSSSSSSTISSSVESEKPKKSDKKSDKKSKKDKHSSDEEDTEMPVYE